MMGGKSVAVIEYSSLNHESTITDFIKYVRKLYKKAFLGLISFFEKKMRKNGTKLNHSKRNRFSKK